MLRDAPAFTIAELIRELPRPELWESFATGLRVGGPAEFAMAERPSEGGAPLVEALRIDGFVKLEGAIGLDATKALVSAVSILRNRGLHPVFLYVFDEAWHVLNALGPALSTLLGGRFDVLADIWAWHVDPRQDQRGWLPHRGWYQDVRMSGGRAGLLNVWVSLTDATTRNACIHLVPIGRDPYYPARLSELPEQGIPMPTIAGTALVWNANVAHWGGTCDPSHELPRVSISFTVKHPGLSIPQIPILPRVPDLQGRLDLIASQLSVYGGRDLEPASPLLAWGRLVEGMHGAAAKLRRKR